MIDCIKSGKSFCVEILNTLRSQSLLTFLIIKLKISFGKSESAFLRLSFDKHCGIISLLTCPHMYLIFVVLNLHLTFGALIHFLWGLGVSLRDPLLIISQYTKTYNIVKILWVKPLNLSSMHDIEAKSCFSCLFVDITVNYAYAAIFYCYSSLYALYLHYVRWASMTEDQQESPHR